MMTGRIDESLTTPSAWVDLLDEYDHELRRVRLFWRRGGGRYRPVVRPDVDLAALENAPLSEWEAHEYPEACATWIVAANETAEQRRARLRKIADRFWQLAVEWTRANGPICDLQLRGYAADSEQLFESGKRCNLPRDPDPAEPRAASEELAAIEREREREFERRREARLMGDVHQIHHTYGDLLGSLKAERDEAVRTVLDVTRTLPSLFGSATDSVRDVLSFQREHTRETVANASGTREFEVRAFAERQQSYRNDRFLEFMWNAFQSGVGSLGPLVAQVVQAVSNKTSHGIPEFQIAQQAIAYLHLTLMPGQLAQLFPQSSTEFMDILLSAAAKSDEAEALFALKGMEGIFRSPGWAAVAMPDQQIAARFIVGRAAMLRIRYEAAGAHVG